MFTQIENPFGAIVPISYSSINTEYSSSNESSNILKIILGIFIFIGGLVVFCVLKKKNDEAEAAKIEVKKVNNGLNSNGNV